jgi:hypothetical protein
MTTYSAYARFHSSAPGSRVTTYRVFSGKIFAKKIPEQTMMFYGACQYIFYGEYLPYLLRKQLPNAHSQHDAQTKAIDSIDEIFFVHAQLLQASVRNPIQIASDQRPHSTDYTIPGTS